MKNNRFSEMTAYYALLQQRKKLFNSKVGIEQKVRKTAVAAASAPLTDKCQVQKDRNVHCIRT